MKKYLLFAGLAMIISFSLTAQSQLNKSFTGIKIIRVSTASGDLKIVKSTNSTVTVDLKHTFGDNYDPELEQEGDRLVIQEKFSSNHSSGSSLWTLSVPDGVSIDFSTGSGNIEASDLALDLDVKTGSGDIDVRKYKGDMRSSTGSGNVTLVETAGEIKTNCGSGNISVEKMSGELTANCGSGDIRIRDSNAIFTANTGSGTVKGANLTLAGSSKFNSGSGNAQVALAKSPEYNIAINSGSGDAILDFNGNKIAGEIVMKANKKNGTIKAPFDFDTTEEIEQGGNQVVVKKTAKIGNSAVKISIATGSGLAQIK